METASEKYNFRNVGTNHGREWMASKIPPAISHSKKGLKRKAGA